MRTYGIRKFARWNFTRRNLWPGINVLRRRRHAVTVRYTSAVMRMWRAWVVVAAWRIAVAAVMRMWWARVVVAAWRYTTAGKVGSWINFSVGLF
jgi:hypothetical protein